MQIVVEGPDNSGKSTLIRVLTYDLRYPVIRSPGPCRDAADFLDRYQEFRKSTRTIFDRHACVSEPIYGIICGRQSFHNNLIIQAFYDDPPIFIYCRGRDLKSHRRRRGVDTAEHLSAVEAHHKEICDAYEEWALMYADIFYDINDHLVPEGRNRFKSLVGSTKYLRQLLKLIIWERENGIIRPCRGHRRVPQKV